MDPTIEALARRLHVAPDRLGMLEQCDEAELTRLHTAVTRAIESEDAAVEQGVGDSLRFLPGPLRLTAKRLLFGGRR